MGKQKYTATDLWDCTQSITEIGLCCKCRKTDNVSGDSDEAIEYFFLEGWRCTKNQNLYCPKCAKKHLKLKNKKMKNKETLISYWTDYLVKKNMDKYHAKETAMIIANEIEEVVNKLDKQAISEFEYSLKESTDIIERSAGVWVKASERLPEIIDKKSIPVFVKAEISNQKNKYISKRVAYYFPEHFKTVEWEDWDDYNEEDFLYTENDKEKGVVWLRAGWYEPVNCEKCGEYWNSPLNVIEWLDNSIDVDYKESLEEYIEILKQSNKEALEKVEELLKLKEFTYIKSPELPKKEGSYWCKLNDGLGSKNGVYFNGKEWETYEGQFILEWLDESIPKEDKPIDKVSDAVDEDIANLKSQLKMFKTGVLELYKKANGQENESNAIEFAEWIGNSYQKYIADYWIKLKGNGEFEHPCTTDSSFHKTKDLYEQFKSLQPK